MQIIKGANPIKIVNVVSTADLLQRVSIERFNTHEWGRFDVENNYGGVGYINELQDMELPLLEKIPQAIRKTFNRLFRAYLRNSVNNFLMPKESLRNLQIKFNNENAELRYPNSKTNPYLNPKYTKTKPPYYDWKKEATDEFYLYYDDVITLISSIRNFETHREDAFASSQFDLAKRNVVDPISGIESPGNYLVLCNLVVLCAYSFIEILQVWIDTQTRLGKCN